MKVKKWNRALAVVMALVMGLTMTSTVGFAGTNKGAPQEQQGEEVNLLVMGNSMSNGYGMPDYSSLSDNTAAGFTTNNNFLDEESIAKYNAGKPEGEQFSLAKWATDHWGGSPAELNQWIEDYGSGAWTAAAAEAWNANASNAPTARMSEDAYAWQLKKHIEEQEGVSNVNLVPITFNGMRTDELRAYLDEDYYQDVCEREEGYAKKWIDDNGYEGEAADPNRYRGFMHTHIDAFSASMYNSGATDDSSYEAASEYVKSSIENADVIVVDAAVNNFGSYIGYRFFAKMKLPGEMGEYCEKFAPNTYETIKDIKELPCGLRNQIGDVLECLTSNVEMMKSPAVKEMVNAYAYGTAASIVNHTAEMEMIHQLNPDAKVIVNGMHNPMSGFMIDVNGQKVDMGKVVGKLFELVNTYTKSIDKNAKNYCYASVPADLSTFLKTIADAESYDALMADTDYSMGNYAVRTIASSFIATFMDPNAVDQDTVTRVQEMMYDAAHEHGASNLNAVQAAVNDFDASMNKIVDYAMGTATELDEGCWNLVMLNERLLLANVFAVHPNREGCAAKYAAVEAAYDSGVTAYEQTRAELKACLDEINAMIKKQLVCPKMEQFIAKINRANELIAELENCPLTARQMEEIKAMNAKLKNANDAFIAALRANMEELYAAAQQANTPEKVQKVAEQLQQVRNFIEQIPSMNAAARAEILKQLQEVNAALQENVRVLSEKLSADLEALNAALMQGVADMDYATIVQKMLAIGQKLLALSKAGSGLPEYEKAKDEFDKDKDQVIDKGDTDTEQLEDVASKMAANSISLKLKTDVSFPNHTAKTTVSWAQDDRASGYMVTSNGNEVQAVAAGGDMVYEDTNQVLGEVYTYTVTPYVINKYGSKVTGDTFLTSIVPRADLGKAKIKSLKKGKTSFKVTWKAVKGADSYQISYKMGKQKAKIKTVGAEKLSATVTKLNKNKKYTVKVRARVVVNDIKYFGAWSNSKSFKTKK